ncbi:MAG: PqqD family protein [Actinomycetota bacterium]
MTAPEVAEHADDAEPSPFGPDDRPVAVDDVETAVFEGEMVIFHVGPSIVHRLEAVASAVWLLCDGETTVEAMPGEVAELFGVAADDVRAPIDESLRSLAGQGLLVGFTPPRHLALRPDATHAADGTEIFESPLDP